MMPPRAVLNVVYALRVKDMDTKQRGEFDALLHGWDRENSRGDKALFAPDDESGGES